MDKLFSFMFINLTIVSTGYHKSMEGWGIIRRVEHLWMDWLHWDRDSK